MISYGALKIEYSLPIPPFPQCALMDLGANYLWYILRALNKIISLFYKN